MTEKVRYIESYLPGSIRCVDGTLVVFTRPKEEDDEGGALVGAEPRKPRPGPPARKVSDEAATR